MNNTKWIYKGDYLHENSSLPIDRDILNILYNRGIKDEKEINRFLYSSIEDIRDPMTLADMDLAVNRILKAKEKQEEIWIYGDYDVDGITSTSMCFMALRDIGLNVRYYIPLRDEGYGLNKEALSYIKNEGGDVIITVDCGISSIEEIEHANKIGLNVIITDHHEINNALPSAYAVINPKREDNVYPFKFLAGVGTAFMFLYAIYRKMGIGEKMHQYLDIVAIGTIADIVPLVEENRIFSKFGLKLLENTKHLGLRTLLGFLYPEYETKVFNTYDVGFVIAPVFNAAGRLEDAKIGVELFVSDSKKESREISQNLMGKNNERKEIQSEILDLVEKNISEESLDMKNVIVVASKDFHHGVIGIVASKIVDKYYKPTIIMEIKEKENIAVASCRSIDNFSMIDALNTMPDIFLKYGGHDGAAGFSIPADKIQEFSDRINSYAGSILDESDFQKPVKIEKEILFHKISYEFLDKLRLLEPFGFGNPTPIFSIKNCLFKDLRMIGKDKNHMMFTILKDGNEIKNCVWFSSGHNFQEIAHMREIDVAFKLKQEIFKDRYMNKIYIEDLNPSQNERNYLKESIAIYDTVFPMEAVIYSRREPSDKDVYLSFSDGVELIQERRVAGFIDYQTAAVLKRLKYSYNFNFITEIKKVVKKPENYNIHLNIKRDYSFSTLAYKKNEIFKEIKKFILGELNYNSIQKKILSSVFKEGKRTLAITDPGRGIGAVIETIGIYNFISGKKLLLVTQGNIPEKLKNYTQVSEKYLEGYDYYIFMNTTPGNEMKTLRENILVISHTDISIEGFHKIKDSYSLPQNIKILPESQLVKLYDIQKIFYTKKLPYKEKIEILKNIKNYTEIFSTKDILAFF
ncbi:single-stranded-DNA-specific exonuclease RecJ [Ilyobacter polytropus]|uniref:Single-stranded-DNA-specific exonuclease RecJ n=1 Tax=Ilyobacter polytropus (strain ATCC 51220 / DSM 2926 / LMG 16218 / CuHBu1) TaxID=572544 RepID=E3H5Y3_ILYPC|nr:single-stranded-DNA-specific exonuclease RecJ [Ilyobacter polytropus]ADO82273.1 exonuclease RecJ [Ilyobacter polytropus DSM 2926]